MPCVCRNTFKNAVSVQMNVRCESWANAASTCCKMLLTLVETSEARRRNEKQATPHLTTASDASSHTHPHLTHAHPQTHPLILWADSREWWRASRDPRGNVGSCAHVLCRGHHHRQHTGKQQPQPPKQHSSSSTSQWRGYFLIWKCTVRNYVL